MNLDIDELLNLNAKSKSCVSDVSEVQKKAHFKVNNDIFLFKFAWLIQVCEYITWEVSNTGSDLDCQDALFGL